jgi:hypothetical protein
MKSGGMTALPLSRLHRSDYTPVWLALTLIAVAACIFIRAILPETMQNPKQFAGLRQFFVVIL